MIEMAVAYLGAYLGRKALGILDRAAGDVDDAVDDKLGQLYDWVKGKFTGRPSGELSLSMLEAEPAGDKQQALVEDQIKQIVDNEDATKGELQALVDELERVRPKGISIRGLAQGEDVYGKQVGVKIKGPVADGSDVEGRSIAKTVHEGGENIGVELENLP